MSHSLTPIQTGLLQECLTLAVDPTRHAEANRQFLDLQSGLSASPDLQEVMKALWKEVLAARRSAAFWEHLSDVEKSLSARLADSNIQLQQNYLRLVQEQ